MDKRVTCGAIVLALVILGWSVYNGSGDNYKSEEPSLVSLDANLDRMSARGFFHPRDVVPGQGVIYSRHRYPEITGGNVSTLIHHGYDQLRVPAPRDRMWIECPPGEVQFLWLSRVTSAGTGMGRSGRPERPLVRAVASPGCHGQWGHCHCGHGL